MSQPPPAVSAFERRLTGILERSDSADEQQSALLALLIREVHTIKWILAWVLIIVPTVVVVFGLLLTAAHQTPTISRY